MIDFFNYLFPGKRLGAISQKLGNWNYAIVIRSNKKSFFLFLCALDIVLDGTNITDGALTSWAAMAKFQIPSF